MGAGLPRTSLARYPVAPGDVVGGKFVVDGVLGAGAMGVVVAARHAERGEQVAIKFLVRADRALIERFMREIRTIARLQSEHVSRVLDAGKTADGIPYMVMEYLRGETLAQRFEGGPVAPEEAVELALQICEGLAEPHAAGIIHRDIKPANLFLVATQDGPPVLKVLDFGVAKSADRDGDLTTTNAMLGSPSYASPEQLAFPKDVDARADIWAIGVILYEALTGKLPFKGESVADVCMNVIAMSPPSVHAVRNDVPAGIVEIVDRCLEKQPIRRFANVADLADALEGFASERAKGTARRVRETLARPPSTTMPPAFGAGAVQANRALAYVSSEVVRKRIRPSSTRESRRPVRATWPAVWLFAAVSLVAAGITAALLVRVGRTEPSTGNPVLVSVDAGASTAISLPEVMPAAVVAPSSSVVGAPPSASAITGNALTTGTRKSPQPPRTRPSRPRTGTNTGASTTR